MQSRTPHTHDKTEEVGFIDLENCKIDRGVEGYGSRPFLFRVTTEMGLRFLLEAVSASEMQGWVTEIEAARLVSDEDDSALPVVARPAGDDMDMEDGGQDTTEENITRPKAMPFFRKLSQAEVDTTDSTVRLKRKNTISGKGDRAEIIGLQPSL